MHGELHQTSLRTEDNNNHNKQYCENDSTTHNKEDKFTQQTGKAKLNVLGAIEQKHG